MSDTTKPRFLVGFLRTKKAKGSGDNATILHRIGKSPSAQPEASVYGVAQIEGLYALRHDFGDEAVGAFIEESFQELMKQGRVATAKAASEGIPWNPLASLRKSDS